MTLKIEITVPDDAASPSDYIDNALAALGFVRRAGMSESAARVAAAQVLSQLVETAEGCAARGDRATVEVNEAERQVSEAMQRAAELDAASTPKRERGQPSPGKARRTKAEIAEDDEADRIAAIYKADGGVTDANIAAKELAIAEGHDPRPVMGISTGGERVDPEADQAQDKADEAAEAEASRKSDAPTLDDLRRLMGAVQKKHGMAVAATIPARLGKSVADLSADELPGAIATVQALLDGKQTDDNSLGMPSPEMKQSEVQAPATADDVRAAMAAYALKYDGYAIPADRSQIDAKKMPFALEDSPKVFKMLFGDSVVNVSGIPASPENYAKAVAGLREMLTVNPFKR